MGEAYVRGMQDELRDLNEKIVAANHFIYNSQVFEMMDCADRSLLIKQVGFMESYSRVLAARIFKAA